MQSRHFMSLFFPSLSPMLLLFNCFFPTAMITCNKARTESAAAVLRGELRRFSAEFENVNVAAKTCVICLS